MKFGCIHVVHINSSTKEWAQARYILWSIIWSHIHCRLNKFIASILEGILKLDHNLALLLHAMHTLVWITVSRLLDLYYYNTIVNYLAHVHQMAFCQISLYLSPKMVLLICSNTAQVKLEFYWWYSNVAYDLQKCIQVKQERI